MSERHWIYDTKDPRTFQVLVITMDVLVLSTAVFLGIVNYRTDDMLACYFAGGVALVTLASLAYSAFKLRALVRERRAALDPPGFTRL